MIQHVVRHVGEHDARAVELTAVSGRVRRANCSFRIRNGSPPKWSPCRWDTNTAAISPGWSPLCRSALSEVAPQSSSTGAAPRGRRWMQAWYRPPLPNASPQPANVTVTDVAPRELTATILAGTPRKPSAVSNVSGRPLRQRGRRQSRRSGGGPRLGGGSALDGRSGPGGGPGLGPDRWRGRDREAPGPGGAAPAPRGAAPGP